MRSRSSSALFVGRRLVLGGGLSAFTGLAACSTGTTVRTPIQLDGRFDDWVGVPTWSQTRKPSGPVRALWATDDAQYWYVSFTVRDSVSHSSRPGTLHLLIDTDAAALLDRLSCDTRGMRPRGIMLRSMLSG